MNEDELKIRTYFSYNNLEIELQSLSATCERYNLQLQIGDQISFESLWGADQLTITDIHKIPAPRVLQVYKRSVQVDEVALLIYLR